MKLKALWLVIFLGCVAPSNNDFVVSFAGVPTSLNPILATDTVAFMFLHNVYEGLTTRNESGEVVHGLASSHKVSEDGLTYTFFIRPEARFSDGQPITAHDFVKSWLYALNPHSQAPYVDRFFMIEGSQAVFNGGTLNELAVKALDDHTLEVRLVQPMEYFLALLANQIFAALPNELRTTGVSKVGSGAYSLGAYRWGESLMLHKNPFYWESEHPILEEIEIKFITDAITAYGLFKQNQLAWQAKNPPMESVKRDGLEAHWHSHPINGSVFYLFNHNKLPLDDVRVREALSLVLDRELMVQHITGEGERASQYFIPFGQLAQLPSPAVQRHKAQALLAEAGFAGGLGFPPLKIRYNNTLKYRMLSEYIQQQWQNELGITLELVMHEGAGYMNRWHTGDFDIIRASWFATDYEDDYDFLRHFLPTSSSIRTGYDNPRYTELVGQGSQYYEAAQRVLIDEDMALLNLYHQSAVHLFRSDLWGGFTSNQSDMHPFKYFYSRASF